MIFRRMEEDSDIINGNINFRNLTEEVFHERLCIVRRLLYAHGQTIVSVVTERSCDCAKILALFIKLKRRILHGDIDLRKESIAITLFQNILYSR